MLASDISTSNLSDLVVIMQRPDQVVSVPDGASVVYLNNQVVVYQKKETEMETKTKTQPWEVVFWNEDGYMLVRETVAVSRDEAIMKATKEAPDAKNDNCHVDARSFARS